MLFDLYYYLHHINDAEIVTDAERHVIRRFDYNDMQDAENEGYDNIIAEMYQKNHQPIHYEERKTPDNAKLIKMEAYLTNVNDGDVAPNDFEQLYINGKMSLLNVNINPDTMDIDVESDIRSWFHESKNLFDDTDLDKKTIIKYLPPKSLLFLHDGNKYKANNCKIIRILNKKNAPYFFTVLIEKITKL